MQPGERIREYVLERRIGAGGMGEVWRAHHQTLRRAVAIKIIDHGSRDSTFRDRFSREAQAMTRLAHPAIVPIHDFFIIGGNGYLVMGLIEGGCLADLGRVSCSVALRIAAEILDALNFAHQQGVIHRDVKPSNILIDERGHAFMTDFGIALVAGTERITRLTRSGTAVGTPEYMSPEQITTPEDIDHRTDVYSFGCVLYEMLAGQPPFGSRDNVGTTEFELMQAHVKQMPVPIRQRNVEVDRNTDRVITQALAKDREQRFAGCGEMAQALLNGMPAAGSSPGGMPFAHLLFSLQGRLTRAQLWQGLAAVAGLYLLAALVAQSAASTEGLLLVVVSLLIGSWPAVALTIKRWHDLDRSAWWLLSGVLLIPLIWIAFELLFLKGTDGPNRFGPAHS